MVTGLSKPLDHNEPFEFESDNETTEVEANLQLYVHAREACPSHRQGNEFQNKFQITNNERCNEYCEKRISYFRSLKANVEALL
jgi:hypothetical protein